MNGLIVPAHASNPSANAAMRAAAVDAFASRGDQGRRARLAISLGRQAPSYGPEGFHGEFALLLCPILLGMPGHAGLTVLPPFVAWRVPYVLDAERGAMREACRPHWSVLGELTPMRFPRMGDDDKRVRPL